MGEGVVTSLFGIKLAKSQTSSMKITPYTRVAYIWVIDKREITMVECWPSCLWTEKKF